MNLRRNLRRRILAGRTGRRNVSELPRRGSGRPRLTPAQQEHRAAALVEGALFVRAAREQLGTPLHPVTQEQLAAMLDVSRTLVAGWEQGSRSVGKKYRAAIELLLADHPSDNGNPPE